MKKGLSKQLLRICFSQSHQPASVTHYFLPTLPATNDLSMNFRHLMTRSFLLIPDSPNHSQVPQICCFLPAKAEIPQCPSPCPQGLAPSSLASWQRCPEGTGQGESKPTSFTRRTEPSCAWALIPQSQWVITEQQMSHLPSHNWTGWQVKWEAESPYP